MPWLPELFTAPALARIWEDERRRRLALVPFFAGVMTGETRALVESFAGAPEVHHPVRGRIKGVAAFERFVSDLRTWLAEHSAAADDIDFVLTPGCGVEELNLHLDTDNGRIELPVAIASDHDERGRIVEQRIYFSSWPLTGGHAIRPPVLQPRPGLDEPDVVGDYQRALAAGDADAVMAAFEPDASVREPGGRAYTHHGADELRALYERFFSNGGGIGLEHCAVTDDGRACALEYNVVAWGRTTLPPQAGLAIYVRGDSGRLATARIYDDADPPLTAMTQRSADDLVKVATAQNQAEAEFVQNLLRDAGVPSVLRRSAGADVPDFLAAGQRDVLVPASLAKTAREALTPADAGPGAS